MPLVTQKDKRKILIIDDDPDFTQMLKISLQGDDYLVTTASNGLEGLKQSFETRPDLVVLDIMMPQMDGLETCSRLREMSNVPILLLTAKAQKKDVVKGLDSGADDYLTKPFSTNELKARIRALLRRNTAQKKVVKKYTDDVLSVDLERKKVLLKDAPIELTTTEFELLACLIAHGGQVVTYREIIRSVWGQAHEDKSLVQTYITYLRNKIDNTTNEHQYIRTQWGKGYWFAPNIPTKELENYSIKNF